MIINSKRSRHPPNFYKEKSTRLNIHQKKHYSSESFQDSEKIIFKRLRKNIMFILASHMQYTRNDKPLHQDSTHISESDFSFLREKINLNGRFKQSKRLEESLGLIKKNNFGDDSIEIGNIWFRLRKSKTFTITYFNKKEKFSSKPTLILKFVRTR